MNCLSISERFAISGTADGKLRVLHLASGNKSNYFQSVREIRDITILNSTCEMYVCSDLQILCFSLGGESLEAVGNLLGTLQRHRAPVLGVVALSPILLLSHDTSGQVVLWILDEPASFIVASSLKVAGSGLGRIALHSQLDYMLLAGFKHYTSLWQPNNALSAMLAGKEKKVVSNKVRKAQAIALSFSEAKIRTRTYQICRIL